MAVSRVLVHIFFSLERGINRQLSHLLFIDTLAVPVARELSRAGQLLLEDHCGPFCITLISLLQDHLNFLFMLQKSFIFLLTIRFRHEIDAFLRDKVFESIFWEIQRGSLCHHLRKVLRLRRFSIQLLLSEVINNMIRDPASSIFTADHIRVAVLRIDRV